MKSIVTMLLTRLQTARTDNYTYYLVYFFMYLAAVDVEGLTLISLLVLSNKYNLSKFLY